MSIITYQTIRRKYWGHLRGNSRYEDSLLFSQK